MIFKNHVAGNEIIVYADAALYSKDAVFKCLYWYGDKFHTSVTVVASYYQVSLIAVAGQIKDDTELRLYLQKLERDLVDFNLRDIVTKETQHVRDLLIAKAFSNGEYDEFPPGEK